MGHTLTVRLDKDLGAWLEAEAARTGVAQGKIVRDELERARKARGTRPFMRLAGTVEGPPGLVMTVDRDDFRVYRRNKRETIPVTCPPERA